MGGGGVAVDILGAVGAVSERILVQFSGRVESAERSGLGLLGFGASL